MDIPEELVRQGYRSERASPEMASHGDDDAQCERGLSVR
jgi:hypothetical protein